MKSDPEDNAEEENVLTGTVGDEGGRLDKVLAGLFPDLSRSRLKTLILDGAVGLDGAVCADPSRKVRTGSSVTVIVPPPVDGTPMPEAIPLDIVYEDDALLVINKPAGLVVHPGAGNWSGTLVNALLYHCGEGLSGIGGVRRPGIVHRLDKDTSGLMVAAKSDKAHKTLSAQLADRTLGRWYKAVVWGVFMPANGHVDQPIGRHPSNRLKMAVVRDGRAAVTHYRVEEQYADAASLLECRLETGRTHQIRVHMAHIRHPLIGDPLYGQQRNAGQSLLRKAGCEDAVADRILSFPHQALHAWKIHFRHPLTGEDMEFESPVPAVLENLINDLKSIC